MDHNKLLPINMQIIIPRADRAGHTALCVAQFVNDAALDLLTFAAICIFSKHLLRFRLCSEGMKLNWNIIKLITTYLRSIIFFQILLKKCIHTILVQVGTVWIHTEYGYPYSYCLDWQSYSFFNAILVTRWMGANSVAF